MILLDTNICIYIINAKPPAVLARFKQYRMGDMQFQSETQLFERTIFTGETNVEPISLFFAKNGS